MGACVPVGGMVGGMVVGGMVVWCAVLTVLSSTAPYRQHAETHRDEANPAAHHRHPTGPPSVRSRRVDRPIGALALPSVSSEVAGWPGGRVGECDARGAKCGVVRRTLPGCGLRRAEIGRRRRRKKEGVGGGGVSVSVCVCVRWGGRLADWIGLAK